jgi:hypothetical protein
MWDLWLSTWHWGRFSPSTSVSPANSHSTDYSTLIIYHLGLAYAKYWPKYQVHSVLPHPEKLKTKVKLYTCILYIGSTAASSNGILYE